LLIQNRSGSDTGGFCDQEQNDLDAEEKVVADLSKRWLAATGARFGVDSNEYEAMGGTRLSERKKPKAKGSGGTGGTPIESLFANDWLSV